MEEVFKFELGEKVRDRATGFVGVITGRMEYTYSEPIYQISGIDSAGRPADMWYSAGRMESAAGRATTENKTGG